MWSLPVDILLLFIHHTVVIHVLLRILALLNLRLVNYLFHCLLLHHILWIVYYLLLHVVMCLLLIHVLVVLKLFLHSLCFFQLVVFKLRQPTFVAWVSESEVLVQASAAGPSSWSLTALAFFIWRSSGLKRFVAERSLLFILKSFLVLSGLDDGSFFLT